MFKKQLTMIVFTLCVITSYAQVKINGVIYDEYLEPFSDAYITHGNNSAVSNSKGEFTLTINGAIPQSIIVSAFGYKTENIEVTQIGKKVNVILKENILLDQVVISASRVPERIIESPVTIERFGLSDIKRNSSSTFYDGLVNLKGIQSRESSYGLKVYNARGFATLNNPRFVQMVDGVDTTVPGLNPNMGNLAGAPELDILSVEILPGASSALYGANAFNGILLMRTKNPFEYSGISVSLKGGATQQQHVGTTPFHDTSIRMAHKFNETFAAKVNFSYFEAEEWHANNTNHLLYPAKTILKADRYDRLDYDGVNIYGDEFGINFANTNMSIPSNAGLYITRTGYTENELLQDYKTKNLKFQGSLHFRPFENKSFEIELGTKLVTGDNMFQGDNRYAQRNYFVNQNKIEIKSDNFYIRGYHTSSDSGNTYDLTKLGLLLNEKTSSTYDWARSFITTLDNIEPQWFVDYQFNNSGQVANRDNLIIARNIADSNRLKPGTAAFNSAFNEFTSKNINNGGAKIWDQSETFQADGNYNFKNITEWADIQVGGSFRQYNPNSRGTLFNDEYKKIEVNEYGFYSQIQKKLFDDRLKLTGSIRYDKAENLTGNYSPRFAANYITGEDRNHVFRASYQTGFRNPTIQEQYLLFYGDDQTTIGGSIDNLNNLNVKDGSVRIKGEDILNKSYIKSFLFDPTNTGDDRFLRSNYKEIKPEDVSTYEIGYKSIIGLNNTNNLDFDINGFYSEYNNLIFRQEIVVPLSGTLLPDGSPSSEIKTALNTGDVRNFAFITNSKSKVSSYGFGIGLHTKFLRSFDFGLNYNFIDYKLDDLDFGVFNPGFNTPKHTVKVQIGNDNILKNLGFSVNGRWLDKYEWNSIFVKDNIDSRTVIDAQLNYRISSLKSRFKIGGTNLFGKDYSVSPGTGNIGKLYYVSWIIND